MLDAITVCWQSYSCKPFSYKHVKRSTLTIFHPNIYNQFYRNLRTVLHVAPAPVRYVTRRTTQFEHNTSAYPSIADIKADIADGSFVPISDIASTKRASRLITGDGYSTGDIHHDCESGHASNGANSDSCLFRPIP